jgi:hypothetical protein
VAVFGREKRGDGGVFIEGGGLGEGLGFGRHRLHRTAQGSTGFGPVSSKMMSDRWAPPVSVLRHSAAHHFGRAGLDGPGPFLGLGQLVSPQPFSIFFGKGFPISSFETDLFYFCNKTGTI